MHSYCSAHLGPGFVWKRNFFVADTASVHTYPMKTCTQLFENALQGGIFWKWIFVILCGRGKRNFSKTMMNYYWIQSTSAKENGGLLWFYVSALHNAARKCVRMPKACNAFVAIVLTISSGDRYCTTNRFKSTFSVSVTLSVLDGDF